jgi:hypothetical protein
MFKHAENTMAVNPETLDFSLLSEFLVGTGRFFIASLCSAAENDFEVPLK